MSVLLSFVLFCGFSQCLSEYEGGSCRGNDNQGICKLLAQCQPAIREIESGSFPKVCGSEGTRLLVCCIDVLPRPVTEKVVTILESIKTTTTPKSIKTTTPESTEIITPEMTEITTTVIIETKPTVKSRTVTTSTSPFPTTKWPSIKNRNPGDISKAKCEYYSKLVHEELHEDKCAFKGENLNVGRYLASPREFPHMVNIGYSSNYGLKWLRSGSLISENFVLTCARCLNFNEEYSLKLVRVGITNQADTSHEQTRNVIERFANPQYKNIRYHDIALLKLEKNVDFTVYARPACLYTERTLPEENAIVSGWGKVVFGGPIRQHLSKVVLEHIDTTECNKSLYNRLGFDYKEGIWDDSMVCFGEKDGGVGTCDGEQGGPLQIVTPGPSDRICTYSIIGVTSFGQSCGLAESAKDVFTKVSAYIKWIEDIVWPI